VPTREASREPCNTPERSPSPEAARARCGPDVDRSDRPRSTLSLDAHRLRPFSFSFSFSFALLSFSLSSALGCGVSEYFLTEGDSAGDGGSESGDEDPCLNGSREPWESDVDCGGPICEPCLTGSTCKVDADCTSTICAEGLCSDDPCELDDPCPIVLAPCMSSSCDPEQGCLLDPLPDGLPCGGEDPNEMLDGTCSSGICIAACGPCEHLDGPCRRGVCDPLSGECAALWIHDNEPCEAPGGGPGFCAEGMCSADISEELIFTADFEDANVAWTTGELWEVGEATSSMCSDNGIEDPALDADGGGGLAGTLIGECLPQGTFEKTCLTSPDIDTQLAPTLILRYSEIVDLPPPSLRGTVELFNGDVWSELVETAPEVPEWTQQAIALGDFAAPEIRVRFCVETSEELVGARSGWSVDNVEVVCLGCDPAP